MTKRNLPTALALSLLMICGSLAVTVPATAGEQEPLRGAWTTSITCLTPSARALIDTIEAKFGKMDIISTCRPGARVAGTGEISRHSSGNAIDFIAGDRKAAVLQWLIANHTSGGTMTYASSPHIHVDIGPHWVQLAGGSAFTPGESSGQQARVTKVLRTHHSYAKPRLSEDSADAGDN